MYYNANKHASLKIHNSFEEKFVELLWPNKCRKSHTSKFVGCRHKSSLVFYLCFLIDNQGNYEKSWNSIALPFSVGEMHRFNLILNLSGTYARFGGAFFYCKSYRNLIMCLLVAWALQFYTNLPLCFRWDCILLTRAYLIHIYQLKSFSKS